MGNRTHQAPTSSRCSQLTTVATSVDVRGANHGDYSLLAQRRRFTASLQGRTLVLGDYAAVPVRVGSRPACGQLASLAGFRATGGTTDRECFLASEFSLHRSTRMPKNYVQGWSILNRFDCTSEVGVFSSRERLGPAVALRYTPG
jgi:hypothetical protein